VEDNIEIANTPLKALTSGRFDPPHPGHIINLLNIAKKFESVKCVVLSSDTRRYPMSYCLQILDKILTHLPFDIELKANKTHFAEITKEELDAFDCDIYVGGNLKVLKHIESLGMKTSFIDRSYYYEANKIPLPE
jgi:glycerol-3-phosphate cytidylyltransferase-like family protein